MNQPAERESHRNWPTLKSNDSLLEVLLFLGLATVGIDDITVQDSDGGELLALSFPCRIDSK